MVKRSVIIDCRAEEGDFPAIQAVLNAPTELELCGITTTGLSAQTVAGRIQAQVFEGCIGTLRAPFSSSFKDGGALHSVDFLIHTLRQASGKITILGFGPLTNIALAVVQEPRIRQNIQEIVIVGGAISRGNVTPSAECHFHADPFAASIVLSSRVPLTLLTADLVPQASLLPSLAVKYLLTPSLLVGPRAVSVSVACDEGMLRGYTCIDWWGRLNLPPQVTVFDGVKEGALDG